MIENTRPVDYGLTGKVAIVTGASKGIGYAIAAGLCGAGARVLVVSRDQSRLNECAATLGKLSGECAALAGDVCEPELAQRAVAECERRFGNVDILVNNAGGPPMGGLLEHDDEAWDNAVQMNLMSVVRFTRAVLPSMKERQWGRIVSVSSTVAKEPSPPMILSATARAGVAAFSKSLARDVAADNISINVVCPGGVRTDRMVSLFETAAERTGKSFDEVISAAEQNIPAGRFAEPAEMADVVLFLCSQQGGYINGVNLSVDGGLTRAFT